MQSATKFFRGWGVLASTVLGMVVAGGSLTPAWAQPYDKIQFSPPREVSTARPTSAAEAREQLLKSQRQQGHSLASEMPAGMALPAPEDVNRMRLLQSLIERRREQGSGLDAGGANASLDESLRDDMAAEMSIDDLFDRYGMGRDARDRGTDNEMRLERRREESRRRSDDPGRSRGEGWDAERADGEGSGDRDGLKSESESDFLPSMDARDRDFSRSLSGDAGRGPDSFLGSDATRAGAGALRDREDAARLRSERSQVIRRLIGGNRAVGAASGGAARGGAGMGVPGAAAVPGPGRSLGEFMSARPTAPASASPSPDALGGGGVDRSFAMPGRPVELNLRSGGGFRTGSEAITPTVRPMQILQQKHDSRIPVRPF